MDLIPDKFWALIAAVVSAFGGFFVYERRRVDTRLTKIEEDVAQHKTDLAVIKEGLLNLKEDTQEIKDILIGNQLKRRK